MKWKLWKKKDNTENKYNFCCKCGGMEMRQTTLDEFFDLTPKSQRRLFPKPVKATTQSVGMTGAVRRYRGGL